MLFGEILQSVEVLSAGGNSEIQLTGIAYDSRQANPGFLFVAVEGFQTDGHDYILDAVNNGAVAVILQKDMILPDYIAWARVPDSRKALALLSARFYNYPSRRLKMIGVTGTNGKTTTAHLIESVYRAAGHRTGLIGTCYNLIGEEIFEVKHTTPESTDLQSLLSAMLKAGVEVVAMEVSSHALNLHRVDGCEFDIAVFTNLTQDHLDFHENMEDYLAAKSILFSGLQGDGGKNGAKYAIINADDEAAARLTRLSGGQVITYGMVKKADIIAENITVRADGASFTVASRQGKVTINLNLTGKFNVYNALAAYSVGMVSGFSPQVIKHALEGVKGVPGRFELVDEGQDFAVIVDYAHTPDGLRNILNTAREFTAGKLINVFGCGGDRDRTKRPLMGEISGRLSDFTIVTSDNPRREDADRIILDILVGISRVVERDYYTIISDRRAAIKAALAQAASGDVVIIAGKGHETYQIIGDVRYAFDDREEVRQALRELFSLPVT
ncbi:UDP-N-acetylmuramyl-tripeptide synthetase [Desulfofarcimen acetoxidans DSM 771]|uniref:UDP-N-acetylmuramoyl-L-alanyl-D-glutamate--2,6-diaminopimelate ligase n=1 Tax=Desulfofarcimen acetoxidans (strain ATCC 49208 / DSM 771 / KCTC 5769 / VKM B-1644 / 5575) TaxID=485916 RepID=C8W468_DESAS|nr:UDP-N-acetylmuramoyl-L-alanyl-D-glutamate--2,6-diaminopimelate ligase [Desulfofarcimen acetoxidans]ACV61936.1 UDP-N-acetylmuramyl-tripeptide synthetase [Desulfofarcimen acetoxidans DSM 771]